MIVREIEVGNVESSKCGKSFLITEVIDYVEAIRYGTVEPSSIGMPSNPIEYTYGQDTYKLAIGLDEKSGVKVEFYMNGSPKDPVDEYLETELIGVSKEPESFSEDDDLI